MENKNTYILVMGGENIHGRILLNELTKSSLFPLAVINETGTKRAQKLSKFLVNDIYNPPQLHELVSKDIIYNVDKFDGSTTFELIDKLMPEYIVFGGQGIVKEPLLSSKKSLNVHPGLLPNYRGLDPVLWSLLNKEQQGATVHMMSEGIDEGPIFIAKEMPWSNSTSVIELRLHVMQWGGKLLSQFLSNPNKFQPQEQDLSEGLYYQAFPEDRIEEVEQNLSFFNTTNKDII
ncbi:MAG: hypothetical protein GY909_14830 [Oligoflexia bacterium]|nr:hypothetical protein [Oligoflexia bacterium]